MTEIVTVNASVQAAPLPATLQQSGALISQGATNLSQLTSSPLTQLSDLTPLLQGGQNLTGLTYAGGTVTATVAGGHGFPVGDTLLLTVAGATPTGYNGTWECAITSSTQFTYEVPSALTTIVTLGIVTDEDVAELVAMATTYFAQSGTGVAVNVLELGYGSSAQGVATLTNYITANPNSNYRPGYPGFFYAYLVPRAWSSEPTFITMLGNYESPTGKTYFYTTVTLQNYTSFTSLMKDGIALIESPALGVWLINNLVGASWVADVATFTTTTNHGVLPGEWFQIAGCAPTTWNGWYLALPGTTGSTIIAELPTNPGPAGTQATGTITFASNPTSGQDIILNGLTWTFVTSGATGSQSNISGTIAQTISGLASNLSASSNSSINVADYTYNATQLLITYISGGTGGNAYTLSAGTVTSATASGLTLSGGIALGGELDPSYHSNAGVPATEFSLAATFFDLLQSNPSTTNQVPPFAFRFQYGVTPFPVQGKQALRSTLIGANINFIDTGAEGGISDTILTNGTTLSGADILQWYAIDWDEINLQVGLANAVINGSNNPLAPLYYDQAGIQTLQQRGQAVQNNGVAFGLLLNAVSPTVQAVPFNTYVEENPADYEIGKYAGLSCVITPQRGFISLVFDLVVTFFPTGNF